MKLTLEVTEELGEALSKSAKEHFVSIEDEVRQIVSGYFAYLVEKKNQKIALGSMLSTAGEVLTHVAATFQQKVDQEVD